ncbi:beta-lactamase family protein [Spirosoma sp. BT702]|uniref:Beta-lactamase family protein n=1 Tax=Spirosoma profusum TaxID=2771354 RepID=A0A927AS41_9BACT|nr:serine hydrolase domain-containing protein [Spirosoma profusum]MBD2703288.1 beta-lactamase family protein [Spirosoma profusum]
MTTKTVFQHLLLFLNFSALTVFAQTATLTPQSKIARIDSFLTVLTQYHLFNGSILVAEKGQIIYQKSAGFADSRRRISNSDTTHFNLASLSKPFTAIAVLQLVQKGKLKLDDTFATHFPDFPYSTVTIRHLLTHTSGLPDLERQEDKYISEHPDELLSAQTLYAHLLEQKKSLNGEPGDGWRYNNMNYILLARLVERVSQTSFADYMKKYVFLPAGMLTSYVRQAKMPNTPRYTRPASYFTTYHNVDSLDHRTYYTYYNLGSVAGPGNIISTLQELWKFDRALNSGKLLNQSLLEAAFTPVTLNNGKVYRAGASTRSYGLGWTVYHSKTEPTQNFVFHDGHIVGLTTFLHRNLTADQTIIFYDNTDNNPIQVMVSVSNILNGTSPLKIQMKQSLVRVYGEALVKKGSDYAATTFNTLKDDTTNYYVDELEMNRLGFDLLSAPIPNHITLSLEAFKLNTLLYPKSGNTYDSYAIALEKDGKKEEAIAMYRKSIVLWPGNEDGKRALQKLLDQK